MKILTREEAMLRLRLKPAFFSKLVNGKVKGVTPPPCLRIGRRQLFAEDSLESWAKELEARSCNEAR
jgi:hypothetical protein